MREQQITIRLGQPLGDPNAEDALRSALVILQLLESLDKNSWQVRQARYSWKIARVSKNSPFELGCNASIVINQAERPDVVGFLFEGLRAIEVRKRGGARLFGREEYRLAARIGVGASKRTIPTEIIAPKPDGRGFEVFRASDAMRRNAKLMDSESIEYAEPTTEYVVLEGYLRTIQVDDRSQSQFLRALEVIERDTQKSVWCDFKPGNEALLGAHAGGRVIVEGNLTTDADGKQHMMVAAFKLIPQIALSVNDLRERGLRLPDNVADSVEYMRQLRADNG